LGFCPEAEGFDLWFALLQTRGKADLGDLASDVSLDVIKRADTIESLASNFGFVGRPDIVEVTSPMRPAGSLLETRCPICSR